VVFHNGDSINSLHNALPCPIWKEFWFACCMDVKDHQAWMTNINSKLCIAEQIFYVPMADYNHVMLAALQTYKHCIHCVDHINDNEVRLVRLLVGC